MNIFTMTILRDKYEKRTLFNYVALSVLCFLTLATINFGLIAGNLKPVNIVLPAMIGIVVGWLLGINAILRKRLTRSNRTKIRFLSRMNHELRTPMNAILGFAELLDDDESLTADQHEEVKSIINAGNHTLALINELLDYASIETGKIKLEIESLSIEPALTDAIAMVKPLADKRNIQIDCDMGPARNLLIHADHIRLTEIFINLLSNAIKYNREAGNITVKVSREADRLLIHFDDTGIGIDPSMIPFLYEPFNRLGAENTPIEGSGVGLTITRSLVEMMNGEISCESQHGKGTCFGLAFQINPQ